MSQSDFVTRGQALVSSGQYQEAVKVCRLGLLGRPTAVEGRIVLGQALLALKRYDEVLAEMRVALELDHSSVPAQLVKGEALLRKGDGPAAVEVLGRLREAAGAPEVARLLGEAERLAGRGSPGATGSPPTGIKPPAVSVFEVDEGTAHYPGLPTPDDVRGDGGGEYTKPTSVSAGTKRRSSRSRAAAEPGSESPPGETILSPSTSPSPAELEVGDHSGTVEVDPALDAGDSDEDFGDLVGPPVGEIQAASGKRGGAEARRASTSVPSASAVAAAVAAKQPQRSRQIKEEVSTVELGDEEIVEIQDAPPLERRDDTDRKPGPGTAVRNAVKLPSGPIDLLAQPARESPELAPLPVPGPPAHLAQLLANQAATMNPSPGMPRGGRPLPQPYPEPPLASPSFPGASPMRAPMPPAHLLATRIEQPPLPLAMPPPVHQMSTRVEQPPLPLAMQSPPMMQPPVGMEPLLGMEPLGIQPLLGMQSPMSPQEYQAQQVHQMQQLPSHLQSSPAASRPTIALPSAPPPRGNGHPGQDGHAPVWDRATMLAPAVPSEPPRYQDMDPQLMAMFGGGAPGAPAVGVDPGAFARPPRVARKRSRLSLAVWLMIGAAVIGGGVFAGFQIRSLRLHRQIAAARERSVDLAKADTWQGWIGARDSLYSIAQASPTADNKAALARARSLIAYEFGDGLTEARAAVEGIAGHSLDLDLAAAYLALAQNDPRAAHDAAERAQQAAPDDAAAAYASGQAALLGGDIKTAIAELRRAFERDPRPLHAIGLARALGAGTAWDEALATIDRAGDAPAAVIAKAVLQARGGQVGQGVELRAQLAKLIADGAKPSADQPRSVSPTQLASAYLALAQVDFARGDAANARADFRASLELGLNDQRFAEELSETLYAIGELEAARKSSSLAIEKWPASLRARTTLAEVWLGLGEPAAALELFSDNVGKLPEAAAWPKGQVVRGHARLATGDTDGASADFEAALKKLPGYEPALVAQAWLDLASGDLDSAKQLIEPRLGAKRASPAVVAVYGAILRATGEPAARAKARGLLERVGGGPSPDAARAQLELARIDRDLGDFKAAQAAYADAGRGGSAEARMEAGLLQIENGDPRGGRATLEQLLKDSGDHPSAQLLLEAARARILTGAHAAATELLIVADKASGVVRWQLDRERARLAFRRGDTAGAAQALLHALEGCGGDIDTFILAADTVALDDRQTSLAGKLRTLVTARLAGRPEAEIIAGKLDLARGRYEDAEKRYNAAREALGKDNALSRRRAQANYGLAAVAYNKGDDPKAVTWLDLVNLEDPSIYAAYLFAAEIAKPKNPRKALEHSQQAAQLNPDSLDAWKQVGTLAAQLGNKKLLNEAINRVGELAPGSDTLHQLQKLR